MRSFTGEGHAPEGWSEEHREEQEDGTGMMDIDGGAQAVYREDGTMGRPAQEPVEGGAGLGYTGSGEREANKPMEGAEELATGGESESSGQQSSERGEGEGGVGARERGGGGRDPEEARTGVGAVSEEARLMQWLEERCDWLGAGVQVGERLLLSEGKQRRLLHRAWEALRYAREMGASWDEPQGRPRYAGAGSQSSMELTLEQILGHNFFCANQVQAARNRAAGVPGASTAGAEAEGAEGEAQGEAPVGHFR